MAIDDLNSKDNIFREAISEWEKAQVLFVTAAWKGRPVPRHYAEMLSKRFDLEAELKQLLMHENQLVAAYSLITLELMDSSALDSLSEAFLSRKGQVTTIMGSFRDQQELAALARHIQKRWRKRHPGTK